MLWGGVMAGAAGFEPATYGFGDRRSNQTELRSCGTPTRRISDAMLCRKS